MLISSVQGDEEDLKASGLFNPIAHEQVNNEEELLRVECVDGSEGKKGVLTLYEDFIVLESDHALLGLFLDDILSFKVHHGRELLFINRETSYCQALITESKEDADKCYKILKDRCAQQGFHGKYELGKQVGEGKHSVVLIGTHRSTHRKYAIKIQTYTAGLKEEVTILSHLHHPNLVFFHEFFLQHDHTAYIVMDYEDGGDLLDLLAQGELNTHQKKVKFIADMLNALEYLRIKGIVHRDLKLGNILYSKTDGKFKIGWKYEKIVGSAGYMAPELLNKTEQKMTDMKSDIYSMGLIFFEILVGQRFFSGNTNQEILKNNQNHSQDGWFHTKDIGQLEKELLYKMIRKRKEKRKNSYQILKSKLFSKITKKYNLHYMMSSSNHSTCKNQYHNDNDYDVPLMTAVKQLLNIRSKSNR